MTEREKVTILNENHWDIDMLCETIIELREEVENLKDEIIEAREKE